MADDKETPVIEAKEEKSKKRKPVPIKEINKAARVASGEQTE